VVINKVEDQRSRNTKEARATAYTFTNRAIATHVSDRRCDCHRVSGGIYSEIRWRTSVLIQSLELISTV
jgi:hypothetical protein